MKKKDLSVGFDLGNLLRGLGGLLETLQKVDNQGCHEINKIGQFGSSDPQKLKGVYDFKVRFGELNDSSIQPFGSLRTSTHKIEHGEIREPIPDMFDEGDHILVIFELPGIEENQLKMQIVDGYLQLRANGAQNYRVNIPLPCPVDEKTIIYLFKNSILEITLQKTLNSGG
ncbi:MAG: Hsp20/alpha crystallin family protein [Desulfitobacteriaceae bacterium]